MGAADRIALVVERLFTAPVPLRIRAWDGSVAGPDDAPTLVIRSRRALRRLLWQPDEIGLARGWVAGELDVDGDLKEALRRLEPIARDESKRKVLTPRERAELLRMAVLLGAVGPQPKPPPEESVLSGERHSKARDRAAISHHYDVGNDFYRIVLGPSMVYSCAYWANGDSDPAYTLDDAQRDKLDLICRKLGLRPGMRMLDVGCGWGSLVLHAAKEYDVEAVGITLSEQQAEYARKRIAEEGLTDRVEVRLQDWRDLVESSERPFDAIASIGMAEHVGEEKYAEYARALYQLLAPEGRLLNHQIVRRPGPGRARRTFIDAYVFPDGELLPVGRVVSLLEEAGFEARDMENLREHYAATLRRWVANLERGWAAAVAAAGAGRARVWRLYMTGSALSFDAGQIGIVQVLAVRKSADGRSGLPWTRTAWLGVK